MSTGQPIHKCTNGCETPVVRRGMCPECAAERRAAQVWVRDVTAEIRVECKVELPQHVEELTPIATREVVGIRVPPLPKAPERPARVSKGAEPKQDKGEPAESAARAPRARKERAVEPLVTAEPLPPGKRKPPGVADPDAPETRCRRLGCNRPRHARGLCSVCHGGQPHLRLPSQVSGRREPHESAEILEAVHRDVVAHPGVAPREIGERLGLPEKDYKYALAKLVAAKRVARDHRGVYRPVDARPQPPRYLTARIEEILRPRKRMLLAQLLNDLGVDRATFDKARRNLRKRRVIQELKKEGMGWWISLA